MTQDTFKLITDPDGTQYVVQNIDEIDKNHGPDDTSATNQGHMYRKWRKFYHKNKQKLHLK